MTHIQLGRTVLYCPDSAETVELLLNKGADVHKKDVVCGVCRYGYRLPVKFVRVRERRIAIVIVTSIYMCLGYIHSGYPLTLTCTLKLRP